jgi:squalene-associated FAD-dependent desaturase
MSRHPSPMSDADVVVIGAGLAGLSCGWALAQAGLRVTVCEASAVAGGRARSWNDPGTGDVVDIGPHIVLNKYANMIELLRQLGTAGRIHWQTDKLLTVLDKGRHIPVTMGRGPAPLNFLVNVPRLLPSVSLGKMLSNLRVAWSAMRLGEVDRLALDNLDARTYLTARGVSPSFIDWFWASASMALLNVPPERCSAASLMRLFTQMMGHNDSCFGFPTVGLSELYVPGCVGTIEKVGGSVNLNCPAHGVAREADGRWRVHMGDGPPVRAKACVLAVPPAELAALLPGWPVAQDAARFEPSPYVSCYLWFDRRLGGERFWARPWSPQEYNTDFYDVANIRGYPPDVGSVIATNIIWSHRVDGLTDDAIIAATRRELADFVPGAMQARLTAYAVHRIPMSIPCPHPGTENLRPATLLAPGMFIAGDWTRTGLPACMEGAVRSGWLAADAVLQQRGLAPRFARPVPAVHGLPALLQRP